MSIPFNPDEGLVVVPARLSGPNGTSVVRLALDTGATATLVNWDVLMALGYNLVPTAARVRITTGSGVEFAPQIVIQKIEALGEWKNEFAVLCHTLPPSASVDGLLGLDFFRGQRLILDFRNGTVAVD